FPQFFRDKTHEVHYIFRFSCEAFPKFRVLCRHTYRTGIQIADTHHDTSHGHKRSCSESKPFRSEQSRDGNVSSAHELSVRLNADTLTQAVLDQGLVCLCKSQLPRKPRILDRTSRRRSRSSVITGDQDHTCARLRHTCGYGSDT